jgi:hypothetical protein
MEPELVRFDGEQDSHAPRLVREPKGLTPVACIGATMPLGPDAPERSDAQAVGIVDDLAGADPDSYLTLIRYPVRRAGGGVGE